VSLLRFLNGSQLYPVFQGAPLATVAAFDEEKAAFSLSKGYAN